jgi:sialic acid synthase SpsE
MFKIKNRKLDYKKKAFIIAEIGINHNGDIKKAYKLIDAAVKAKCDAVKFQTFDVDTMVHKSADLAQYQKKFSNTNQKKMLKKYELSYESFLKIKKYCDKKKIIFLSTPFDIKSADFLRNLVPAFKISSGDNDNYLLLEHITKFNKPIILSLGMTNHKEIYKILKDIRLNKSKLALLHCISEYPTLLKDSQLGVINELKKTGHIIGFSDHTIGYEASLGAICLGAKIIEKHITLNNNMIGPDHKASLNVKHLRDFIDKIRTMENLVKFQKRKITKNEFKTKLIAKKSLFFSGKINKNDKIKKSNLIPMRPFKNGIPISDYKKILNKKTTSEKSKYQQIKLKDIK